MASSTSSDVSYVLKPTSRVTKWADGPTWPYLREPLAYPTMQEQESQGGYSPAAGNISDSIASTTQHQ